MMQFSFRSFYRLLFLVERATIQKHINAEHFQRRSLSFPHSTRLFDCLHPAVANKEKRVQSIKDSLAMPAFRQNKGQRKKHRQTQ